MKYRWEVTGTVQYRPERGLPDGMVDDLMNTWPDLTVGEASAKADALVEGFMKNRRVVSVGLEARGLGRAQAIAVIMRMQYKNR